MDRLNVGDCEISTPPAFIGGGWRECGDGSRFEGVREYRESRYIRVGW
jgi:hypothetical protein